MPSLRLLTYNVRSMRDDGAALGRVIRSAAPDVVVVQESPRFARWRSRCAELARLANLVVVSGGRHAGANLILSSLSVDIVSSTDVLFTRDLLLHRRGTAIAVLSKLGTRFAVAGIHLDLVEGPRLRHIDELDIAIGRHVPDDVATIVAGDVNDHPGTPTWAALTARRSDAYAAVGTSVPFTVPAAGADQTLDGVFADASVKIVAARVLDGRDVEMASDHRPVLVDLEV